MTTHTSRVTIALLWTAQIAAAAMFLFVGTLKVAGAPPMVQLFGVIGIGQWLRYLTGAIEIVSGLLLLVPGLAFLGASMLAITMVGAVLTHLVIVGGNPTPAFVLLVVTSAIAWVRRPVYARRVTA